jgi:hypothetical protein
MASNPGILTTPSTSTVPRQIIVGNGQFIPAQCTGHTTVPTSASPLHLRNVLIAPSISKKTLFQFAL